MNETSPRGWAGWKVVAAFVAGALIGGVSVVEVVPHQKGKVVLATGPAGGSGSAAGSTTVTGAPAVKAAKGKHGGGKTGAVKTTGGGVTTTHTTGGASVPPARGGLACAAGNNGGSTDQGVTGTSIKMATTVVDSGIGAAFLRDVRFAMEAVRNQVNRQGGICGRQLEIQYVDDGWDAQLGAQYLRNFIKEGIFAIPVGPSSEGLSVVIDSGDIDRAQIPVVGTDGLRLDQYVDPQGHAQKWVWPVATATVSSARIMADQAYARGARNFSIVFDRNYRFGVEAAQAYNAEVHRLTGHDVPGYNSQFNCVQAFCGIVAGQSNYSSDVAQWKSSAGDFAALFLEPETALTWMNDPNTPAASSLKDGYGAAQPLFTRDFATSCQSKCDQMWVWTGFKPYIESYQNDPAVRAYVQALGQTNPQADQYNAFAEGGYIGMELLVDALKKVGPDLTRARLQAVLNNECLATGLTIQPKICYSQGTRFAGTTMQAFQIQYKGTFGGWRAGPIVTDKHPGV